jgi:archaellum biogenesis ATPase FlaH
MIDLKDVIVALGLHVKGSYKNERVFVNVKPKAKALNQYSYTLNLITGDATLRLSMPKPAPTAPTVAFNLNNESLDDIVARFIEANPNHILPTKSAPEATKDESTDVSIPEIESAITDEIVAVDDVVIEPEAVVSVAESELDAVSPPCLNNNPLFAVGKGGSGGTDKTTRFLKQVASWNHLIDFIESPQTSTAKLDAPYFLCSNVQARKQIDLPDDAQYSIIKADIDAHTPLETLYQAIAPINSKTVIYSTYSASKDCQKWRVVTMLDKPANAEEFVMLSAIFNDKLEAAEITPDRSSERPVQISFLPNDNGVFYEYGLRYANNAPPLDWSTVWANELADKKAEKIKLDADKANRLEQSRIKAAQMIATGGLSPRDAFNLAYSIESCFDAYGYVKRGYKWLSPYSTSGVAGVSLWRDSAKWGSDHESDVKAGIGAIDRNGKAFGDAFDLYTHFVHGGNVDAAVIAAGEMFTTDSGHTINKANQINRAKKLDAETDNSDINEWIKNVSTLAALDDTPTATSKHATLPLDFKLYGQRNGEVTVAEIQDKASISHYKKDLFLHPYAPTGDTNYYFTLEQCVVGVDKWGANPWSIGDPNDKTNYYPFEQLPAIDVEVDETPKPKFSLSQFSINNELDAMELQMTNDVFVLKLIALLGQLTVIYAKPNTGKTLLTFKLLADCITDSLNSSPEKRIDPAKIHYINADDSYNGLITKGKLAKQYGFNMIAPAHQKFEVKEFNGYLRQLIADDSAQGEIIILDTLKKFTDLMDKKQGSEFMKLARAFTMKGGTMIMLAHANKNRDSEGKVVFGGTSDITDDCDCAYTLDEVSNDGVTKQVLFENFKKRGDVADKLAFSYLMKGDSYKELFESVKQADETTVDTFVENIEKQRRIDKDQPAIDAIIDAISQGYHSRTELVTYAAKTNSIPKPKLTAVLDNYAGDDVSLAWCKWRVTTGNKNSKLYFLDDAVTGQIELEVQ